MLTLARNAMNTRFELVLPGNNTVALRAAGEEALDEIERLHQQLNLYSRTSEIAHINARAAHEAVQVSPNLFRLLQHAATLHDETGGTFDITVGPLMRSWGLLGERGVLPSAEALQGARGLVGMEKVKLDPNNFTVRFARSGMMLDLGAVGKGYAIERAVEILRELGITSAFLHGGTSTSYGLGKPLEHDAWNVALHYPVKLTPSAGASVPASPPSSTPEFRIHHEHRAPEASQVMAVVPLRDSSLSVSAPSGKFFEIAGEVFGHILNPLTGRPATQAIYAAIGTNSATESDALSTALLIAGPSAVPQFSRLRNGIKLVVAAPTPLPGNGHIAAHGLELFSPPVG